MAQQEEVKLPKGWTEVTLDQISEVITGNTPSKTEPKNYGGKYAYFKPADLDFGYKVKKSTDTLSEIGIQKARFIPAFSTLVTCIGATIGKTGYSLVDGSCNQQINALVPDDNIDNSWLYHMVCAPQLKHQVIEKASSTTLPILNKSKFSKLEIVLAPLPEQKRIVEKLDSLLAQVDSIQQRLNNLPDIIKRFRRSVLAAAVSGKLTEQWRGCKDYKTESDTTVPNKWDVKTATEVCEKVQSGSTPRDNPFDQGGKVPFLKVYNIVNQKIDFDYRPQFVTEKVHAEKLKRSVALPGDVLMNIVGPPLGKVAILNDQYPEWNLNQAITLFRADDSKLNKQYLYFVLCEGDLVRKVMPSTKGSVGQVNISLTQCRESTIPLPTLEEQTEIVRLVEQYFALADTLEKNLANAKQRVDNLTQSILAKAFRGELVPQDPNDEPADKLLARIKAAGLEAEMLEKAAKKAAKTSKK